jgi:hypothetical protein
MSIGPTSKSGSRVGKSASNGVMKHGNRTMSSVCYTVIGNIFLFKINEGIDCVSLGLEREPL